MIEMVARCRIRVTDRYPIPNHISKGAGAKRMVTKRIRVQKWYSAICSRIEVNRLKALERI